jgi:hypothetical protein
MIQIALGAADILFGFLIAGSLIGLAFVGHLWAIGNRDHENQTLRRRLSAARRKLAVEAELQAIADKKAQMLREAREQLRESRAECERLQGKVDHLNVAVRAADEIVVEHMKWTMIDTHLELWMEPPDVVAQFTPEKMTRRMLERTTLAQIHDLLAYAEGPLVDFAAALGFHAFPPDTEFNPDKLPNGFPKKVIDDIEDLRFILPEDHRLNPDFAAGPSPRITAAESAHMAPNNLPNARPADSDQPHIFDPNESQSFFETNSELNKAFDRLKVGKSRPIQSRPAKPKSGGRK